MKTNDKKKLHSLKIEELERKLQEEQQKLVELRMQKAVGKMKDFHAYAKKRKDIAVIATIIRNKKLVGKQTA